MLPPDSPIERVVVAFLLAVFGYAVGGNAWVSAFYLYSALQVMSDDFWFITLIFVYVAATIIQKFVKGSK